MARIMVLDDVLDAVVLIEKILTKQGHEVAGFTDEEEALRYVRKHRVDLAVLDIKLGKMNGIEVLAELKRIDPAIRAVMLTGYPTVAGARQALRLGADEYCVKPIDKDELEIKVARVLERTALKM
ncbi:transcriptional regulatory protein ZraR [bacterium BMS3Bbin14]|nr:transcriptional regulatory protein ZraR [bacterium BMS3Abin13]GBE53810.1 transcriptional regulatory protein ZraR [bacterium BMS3Bbin14]HDK43836.1 response regulator [Desulfobacteraceae bacterium]HDL98027.1 response regulator [Desulfobacteraceae bacterium]